VFSEQQTGDVCADLTARAETVRVAARLFSPPGTGSAETSELAGVLDRVVEFLEYWEFPADLRNSLQRRVTHLRASSGEAWALRYFQCFGHTISAQFPLYETEFGKREVFQQTQLLADISGTYQAFGLDINAAHRDRCDHLSTELEFLAFLLLKEAYATEHDESEQARIARGARQQFLHDHVGKWVPLLLERMEQGAPASEFTDYLRMTAAFLEREKRLLESSAPVSDNADAETG